MNGTAYRYNPYTTPVDQWTEDKRQARAAMPRTHEGFIVNPTHLPKDADKRDMHRRWRAWSQRFPQSLWPVWLEGWFVEASVKGFEP